MNPVKRYMLTAPVFRTGLAPTEAIEGRVCLSPKTTSRPGPVRFDSEPWVREPIDCVSDANVSTVCLMWSAQCSKTQAGVFAWSYLMLEDPLRSLFVFTSDEFGREQMGEKVVPTVRATPELFALVTNKRYLNASSINMSNANTSMVGAAGRQNVKGKSCGFVMADEADEIQSMVDYDLVQELMYRMSTYPGATLWLSSTPVDESEVMEPLYMRGSQGYWTVPCLECGEYTELDVQQMEWETDVCQDCNGKGCKACVRGGVIRADSIFHPCPHCDHRIREADRYAMNLRGKWRHRHEGREIRSYWLPQWYSNFVSWLSICEKARACKNNRRQLKDFVNNVRARGWKMQDIQIGQQEDVVRGLRSRNSGAHDECAGIYISVDCQRAKVDHYYVTVWSEEMDTGRLRNLHHEMTERWQRILELWETDWGELADLMIVDEGDGSRTKNIRALIDAMDDPQGVYTWKGSGNVQRRFQANTEYPQRGIVARESIYRSDAYFRLYEIDSADPDGVEIPWEADEAFIRSLACVKRKVGGARTSFESDKKIDHYFDCYKMACFLSEFFAEKRTKTEEIEDETESLAAKNERLHAMG